jgi:hypothetical protein
MPKYEYKVINRETISLNELNALGGEGWIMCHITPPEGRLKQYVFFREVKNDIEDETN